MESQLQRSYDHTYDDPQNASAAHSDEGERHNEKKSVLNKVKAKAKKIKDTLKKHGHGQEHEHEHDYHPVGRVEDEEDEDEDEEMVEDPEIQVHESAAIRSAAPSQDTNLEKPTPIGEDRYGTKSSDQPAVQGQKQYSGKSGINLENPMATGIAHAPEDKNVSSTPDIHGTRPIFTDKNVEEVREQGDRSGGLEDLKNDPNYVRPGTILASNYETKATDPTDKGEEAQMAPLVQSLDKMNVYEDSIPKSEKKLEKGYTGRHDMIAPQPSPTAGEFASKPLTTSSGQGGSESISKSYDPNNPEEDLPRDTSTGKSPEQSGYIEKISIATSAIADKAISSKNVVASKLGYGGTEDAKGQEIGEGNPNSVHPGTILASNYETKATDSTGKGEEAQMAPLVQSLDKMTVSEDSIPKSYYPNKPEELPRDTSTGKSPEQSGYIEKISIATSAIADKAISAKNVVASKLGYGGTEAAKGQEIGEGKEGLKSSSPTENTHKVASKVTEKLAPVDGTVADADSSVISKVKASTNTGKDEQPELRNESEGKVAAKGVSVREYLTEKLKPGDEDKALSEVISETLHKKQEMGKTKESKPMGKVTESKEVARRLGSGTEQQREGDDAIAAGSESSGKGVVGRIKDAVNLWVPKGGQDQHHSEGSPASLGSKGNSATDEVEERSLHESVN